MAKLRFAVGNISDASIRLDEFRQIANVADKAKRNLLCGPDAPPLLDLEFFVKVI
jgi:hypothetical protein